MVYFTAIELSAGGYSLEHIIRVWWEQNGKTGSLDTATAVSWLKQPGNKAYVRSGSTIVEVKVEPGGGRAPYLRTAPDRTGKDNLLALPQAKLAA